ncbi:hypothetical protein HPP92_015497 [Vanilla planifolia]|uniref:Histone-lysine N-methyltransferase ASHH2 n=1 Tax=Vanilla planifolia TaxID=51239 RepID=A0A835UTB6_VANPL|nr:hypothetical protein HPP92_015497 [Vanilla planifolia]
MEENAGVKSALALLIHQLSSYKKVEFEQNMAERCGSVLKSNTRERQLGEKDLESTLTQETSADNLLSECHGVSSRIDVEFASTTVPCKKSFDSGNSPDSDVYNPHVDFDACTLDGFTSIKLEGVMDQNTLIQETKDPSKAKSKKGQQRKKKNEKRQKKENREKKLRNAGRFNNFPSASSSHPSISKNLEVLGRLEKEQRTSLSSNDGDGLLESTLPIDDIQSCGGRRSVKTRVSKRTFSLACSLRHTRKLRCGQQKRNIQKSEKVLGVDAYPSENGLISDPSRTNDDSSSQGGHIHGETAMSDALLEDASNDVAVSVLTKLSARRGYNIYWASFLYQKWRCVPDELVSIIEKSKCFFGVLEHKKGSFTADHICYEMGNCTVPQEKTDEAINRDLGILEEEDFSMAQNTCGEIALRRQSAAARPTWTLIKSNIFLHRSQRSQTIDEIMVCQCNTRPGGSLGCGEECLNRMLNIECVRGTCPCGDLCSNQQFQRRRYAKFKWIKCGKKGYGLQLEEDVLKGQFLIEYVLDLAAYEARLKNYACRGQKHFYFMTLNGGEVIDACDKGNLGRFINHSCDPNCRTEKWMVNGEVCIGLFAIRDIKKGEEVTFDYNYVRVFGAAAKRCICGSADCRGYIGGDPSNSEVIVQDDSDGEDVEPLMVDAAGENRFGVVEANSEAIEAKAVRHENVSVNGNDFQVNPVISDAMHCPSSKLNLNDDLLQSAVLMCSASEHQPLQDTQLALAKVEPDQAASEPLDVDTMPSISRSSSHGQLCGRSRHSMDTLHADQVVQTSISADPTKFLSKTSDAVTSKKKLTTSVDEENSTSKSSIAMKSLHPVKVKRSMATIKTVASVKTKKVSNTICNRHIEGVEEKLNELLDDDGGIRRQKDAAKGYLKLLVVTSAAGDEISGSVSQSARDLSLILDAILKTKSRMVLVDIINKMVLEFLAEKQILSRDLINPAAPCSRMESFKESMLKLMKHRDSQIQVSARNFSNQWIPRTIRTMKPSDRDDPQMSIKRRGTTKFKSCHEQAKWETDAIVCVNATNSFSTSPSEVDNFGCSASFADSNPEGTRIRKRKSRWDQPAEVDLGFSQASQCSGDQLVLDSIKKPCLQLGTISNSNIPRQTPSAWSERNNSSHETTTESIRHDVEDGEMPPGFESPCIDEHCTNSSSMGEVVIAHPQERYLPHLPVSYGMPLLLMQQLGTPEIEVSNEFGPSFGIAPSFPFKPFPPLPTYPRKDPNGENSTINACAIRPQVKEKAQQEKICTPSNERALCHGNGNGRRFSQWPRHWNNQRSQRCPPNWLQGGNAFRFEGGSRNRVRNLDSGNSRMDGCGGFNPSQGVNNAYFRSKFNRKDCYHN